MVNLFKNLSTAFQAFRQWSRSLSRRVGLRPALDLIGKTVTDFLKRQHLHLLSLQIGLVWITFVCLHRGWKGWTLVWLIAILIMRRLFEHRQRRTTAKLLYRLAIERVRQDRRQPDQAQLNLMALNELNVSSDLHLLNWLDTIVQHFWPLGLCFSFQDALNSKYIGSEVNVNNQTRAIFLGLRFEFFQLNSDFAPTLSRVRLSSNENRTDQLPLRALVELRGSVALTDFREQTTGEPMTNATDPVMVTTTTVVGADQPLPGQQPPTAKSASTSNAAKPTGVQPMNVSPRVMGKTVHLQNVQLRFQILITLVPFIDMPPFFVSIKITALEMPSLLDHSIRPQVLKLLYDESRAQNFLQYLISNICEPFIMPNRLHVDFHRNHYLQQIQHQMLKKLLKFEQRKSLLQLLRRKPIKEEKSVSFKLNKTETMLLNWYKQEVLHKLKRWDLELSQRIHSPVPRFICCVKIIEFMNLIHSGTASSPVDGHQSSRRTNLLTCCLRIGSSRQQLTSPVPLNNSEILINETIWAAVQDFGQQIRLSLLLSERPLSGEMAIDDETVADGSNRLWPELASVQFSIQKQHFDAIFQDETKEKTNKRKQISDIEFYARNGMFDITCNEQRSRRHLCVNGQDLWLPLDQCKSGLVHLQVALFALEANMKTLHDSNQINAALSANLFVRQRKFPVGLLSVYVRQLQVTNAREKRSDQQKADETQNWFISVSFQGRQQQTKMTQSSRNHFNWLQTLHFVLDKAPFDSELVFRLHESSVRNSNDQRSGNEANRRAQPKRHILALLQLKRLQSSADNSLCKRLAMYVGNNETRMLQQLRIHDQHVALRDCVQLGLLSVHVAVRFVHLQANVLQKLQETCCIKAPQRTSTSDAKCGGCRRLCAESIVTERPAEDVKDTELMKLIRQRVDTIQLIQDNSVCQVKLRFRIVAGIQLEVTVERAVYVPQVDLLNKMQVQAIVELWKGKRILFSLLTVFTVEKPFCEKEKRNWPPPNR